MTSEAIVMLIVCTRYDVYGGRFYETCSVIFALDRVLTNH